MNLISGLSLIALAMVLAKWLAGLGLSSLNRRHVLAHANAVPEAFRGMVDQPTYAKSVEYTLAKSRFSRIEDTWNALVLLAVLPMIGAGEPVSAAVAALHHADAAVVLDDGKPRGVVTRQDLLGFLASFVR